MMTDETQLMIQNMQNARLMRVFKYDDVELLQACLLQGADMNGRYPDLKTGEKKPLVCLVAQYCSFFTIRWFLRQGNVDVNARTDSGANALMCAMKNAHSYEDRIKSFVALKEAGVDPMAVDNQNQTLAMYAVDEAVPESLFREIVRSGVDLAARDQNGRTICHRALMPAHYFSVYDFEAPFCVSTIGYLDLNAKDCEGRTPLHYAAVLQDTRFLSLLIFAKGVDVNAVDNKGNRAVDDYFSTYNIQPMVVMWFLRAGGDLFHKNSSGKTLLDLTKDRMSDLDATMRNPDFYPAERSVLNKQFQKLEEVRHMLFQETNRQLIVQRKRQNSGLSR